MDSESVREGVWSDQIGRYIVLERKGQIIKHISISRSCAHPESQLAWSINEHVNGGFPLHGFALDISGMSVFMRDIYSAVLQIPRGETRTYGHIAFASGHSGVSRAAGNALSKNPFPLLIPCHRVVLSNGLGGYRYGSTVKRRLLELEGAIKI